MCGYNKLLEEIKRLQACIIELEHQHKNDDAANQLLTAWMGEVVAISSCGDMVHIGFTDSRAASAFARSVQNERV